MTYIGGDLSIEALEKAKHKPENVKNGMERPETNETQLSPRDHSLRGRVTGHLGLLKGSVLLLLLLLLLFFQVLRLIGRKST